jgi:hypothetical protein
MSAVDDMTALDAAARPPTGRSAVNRTHGTIPPIGHLVTDHDAGHRSKQYTGTASAMLDN